MAGESQDQNKVPERRRRHPEGAAPMFLARGPVHERSAQPNCKVTLRPWRKQGWRAAAQAIGSDPAEPCVAEANLRGDPMRAIASTLTAAALAALLAACSGPAEDAAHRQANAVDAAGERQADALERQAAATPNEAEETALNRKADAVENAADGKSDAMHRQVDKDF
jgi:hypothetical protein